MFSLFEVFEGAFKCFCDFHCAFGADGIGFLVMILAAPVAHSFDVGKFVVQEKIRRRDDVAEFVIGKTDDQKIFMSVPCGDFLDRKSVV